MELEAPLLSGRWAPLKGVRIVDFSAQLPGPLATSVFADLGADVIKVEPPGGEYGRSIPGGMFRRVNRGKASLVLNLKAPCSSRVVSRLVETADIVVESFRPGVAARLGIDYTSLSAIKPDLIYCSLSGYGQTGPWAKRPGHDLAYLAEAGAMSLPGAWNNRPRRSGLATGDLAGAMVAAISLVAALRDRDRNGNGCYLDLSLYEAAVYFTATRTSFDVDEVSRSHLIPTNDIFLTSDEKALALTIVEDHFWTAFVEEIKTIEPELAAPELKTAAGRLREGDRIHALLAQMFRQLTAREWLSRLEDKDVPIALCLTPFEAGRTEQLEARRLLAKGDAGELFCGFPAMLFDGSRAGSTTSSAPAPGADQEQILAELGLTSDEIEDLLREAMLNK